MVVIGIETTELLNIITKKEKENNMGLFHYYKTKKAKKKYNRLVQGSYIYNMYRKQGYSPSKASIMTKKAIDRF